MTQDLNRFGNDIRSFLDGLTGVSSSDVKASILSKANDYRSIKLEPEIRRAELFTELTVGNKTFQIEAKGARSCTPTNISFSESRNTTVFNLTCDLTYFAADHSELGKIRIIQDPRIQTKGWILLRRTKEGEFELPGLSYFNQHLIFHVGDNFFYYPRAWQVVSAITAFPPEFHQYHHLEDDTPIFDFVTKKPNVARKGISTISILDKFSPEEEKEIRSAYKREAKLITSLPASKMAPEDLTPAQESPSKRKKK